jgi:hypothetical protein
VLLVKETRQLNSRSNLVCPAPRCVVNVRSVSLSVSKRNLEICEYGLTSKAA